MMNLDDLVWFFLINKKDSEIITIDNPGFCISINLELENLINKLDGFIEKFELLKKRGNQQQGIDKLLINRSEHDWIYLSIKDKKLEGACGPTNISELLSLTRKSIFGEESKESQTLDWIGKWYACHCDGDWEHEFGLKIIQIHDSKCLVSIDLKKTECEYKSFAELQNTQEENLEVVVQKGVLNIKCEAIKLPVALNIFKNWASQFSDQSENYKIPAILSDFFYVPIDENRSEIFLEKIKSFSFVFNLIVLENVIFFKNKIHFVFERNISLDVYSLILFSDDYSNFIGKKIKICTLEYPFIQLFFEEGLLLKIDLNHTYQGSPSRLELRAQKEYTIGEVWTKGRYPGDLWTLFL